ncbi:hypothetical protein ACX80L_08360 [Arthrobacter sp. MDT1-48-3]
MATEQAAARRVIDRMRSERATAGDPLPAPQQREARIVDAVQAEPAPQQGDDMSAAVARVLARHRAAAGDAAGELPSDVKNQSQKETTVNEHDSTAARRTNAAGGLSQRQADLINSRKATAAERQARQAAAGKNDAAAANRRADQAKRDSGRSL